MDSKFTDEEQTVIQGALGKLTDSEAALLAQAATELTVLEQPIVAQLDKANKTLADLLVLVQDIKTNGLPVSGEVKFVVGGPK